MLETSAHRLICALDVYELTNVTHTISSIWISCWKAKYISSCCDGPTSTVECRCGWLCDGASALCWCCAGIRIVSFVSIWNVLNLNTTRARTFTILRYEEPQYCKVKQSCRVLAQFTLFWLMRCCSQVLCYSFWLTLNLHTKQSHGQVYLILCSEWVNEEGAFTMQ